MSVLSILRRGRQQAKEHSQKVADEREKENQQPKYHHVPTHALEDALSNAAPPTWRYEEDSQKIVDANRRRSMMPISTSPHSHTTGTRGPVRVASSLSQVAYPDGRGTPAVPQVPRAYSYTGGPAYNHLRAGDADPVTSTTIKGKEVDRRTTDRRATYMGDVAGRSSRMPVNGAKRNLQAGT